MSILSSDTMSRAELAFKQAEADALLHRLPFTKPLHGVFSPPSDYPNPRDMVSELIENNRDIYNKFVGHPFPQSLGNGTASLDGFRYYMVQDKKYVEAYIRVWMASLAESIFADIEEFAVHLPSSVQYANFQNDVCVKQLGISQNIIDETKLDETLVVNYIFEDWFALHVGLLPCIMGYWEISKRLLDDPNTVRNTMYHTLWTVLNSDKTFVDAYRYFVNVNFDRLRTPETEELWNLIFRQGCQLEIQCFEVHNLLSSPYHIIDDGIYKIRNFGQKSVLDIFPFGGPLPDIISDRLKEWDDDPVVAAAEDAESESQKWKLTATKEGYTIQNMKKKSYIAASLYEDQISIVVTEAPAYWWINPVPTMPGQNIYQIFVPSKIQNVIQIDPGVFGLPLMRSSFPYNFPYSSVVAENNFQGSTQMWLFEACDSN